MKCNLHLRTKISCDHEFKKIKLIKEYYDYSGFKVGIFECKCIKCGYKENRKYY